jgi:hypothetical protein
MEVFSGKITEFAGGGGIFLQTMFDFSRVTMDIGGH